MLQKQTTAPSPQAINQLIRVFQNGHFAQALNKADNLLQAHPNTFVLHHISALSFDALGQFNDSIPCYERAISLVPQQADLYFNLGIAYTNTKSLPKAIKAYEKAIQLESKFFEAYGNLGTIYQQLGDLDKAIKHYDQGLKINPNDAKGHYNLGTALRDQGNLPLAIKHYKQAIELFPNYTDAYNNLGETLRDHGDISSAVKHYKQALAINPDHAKANYNMGEFLYLSKEFVNAAKLFNKAKIDDWDARSLYCYYKGEQYDTFRTHLGEHINQHKHLSPLISTLATHYAINFDAKLNYQFCTSPLDFVYHKPIAALNDPNDKLLSDLLNDIETTDIAERVQGMLHYGKQSAGNLFKRPEASFRRLAELVLTAFQDYADQYAGADCELIKSFPKSLDFTSSWYVRMTKGGHLSPHIHEIGWISGAVYLSMPEQNGLEGAFEFGTHGDDYPIQANKTIDDFPKGHVIPKVGDIVLFPSSLFHRTIPFNADSKRICIAFDLKPDFS